MNKPARRSSRFSMHSKQLGQLLQESGEIKVEHVAKALRIQEKEGGLIGQILRRLNACDEAALSSALLKQVQVTDVPCEDLKPDPAVRRYIRKDVCEAEKLCPFEKLGNLLCVVMGNPLNRRAINSIEESTGLKVKPFKAPWPKIKDLIDRAYENEVSRRAPVEEAELDTIQDDFSLEVEQSDTPPETIKAPAPIRERTASRAEAPAPKAHEPRIEGLDALDEANAEVIELDSRGLARKRRASQRTPVAPAESQPVAPAKVDVDLDAFDVDSASEVIAGGDVEGAEHELLEELRPVRRPISSAKTIHASASAVSKPAKTQVEIEPIEALIEEVDDGYFFENGDAPEEFGDEFFELLDQIPLVEVIAESREEYLKAQAKPSSLLLEPAPLLPLAAIKLTEEDFKKLSAGLEPDPVGEWEQKYISSAPTPVLQFEA